MSSPKVKPLRLTPVQEEWLALFGDGYTAKEAAAARGVTEEAAWAAAAKLCKKFQVERRRHLIPLARRYFLRGRIET